MAEEPKTVLDAAAGGDAPAAAAAADGGAEGKAPEDAYADSEAWMAKMMRALAKIEKDEAGNMVTESYLAAMEEVNPVYACLFTSGMIVRQLQSDLTGSITAVRECVKTVGEEAGKTLDSMCKAEIERITLKKCQTTKKNGVKCLLWLNRATSFLAFFIHGLKDGKESKVAAGEAYEAILKPYHGWMARKIVGTAMGMTPKRDVIFTKVGCKDEAEANEMMAPFLGAFEPVNKAVLDLLESLECNFPDKA